MQPPSPQPGVQQVQHVQQGQPAQQGQPGQPGQPVQQAVQIALSNIETIPGRTIQQSLGVATGSTVRAKHIGKDILAGFKNIVGGELKGYTELLTEARNQALERLVADAAARGANAVVNVRFATSAVAGGAAELFAYGTAVIVV
jgi:uncharacterized protein YbjQ (UPF0145 family)